VKGVAAMLKAIHAQEDAQAAKEKAHHGVISNAKPTTEQPSRYKSAKKT
jgi:hypothetical protein